jgi:2-keto-4-pentenoate hydratase/2-oxohepta-3-ene-1,7-dioic acid hydratase in catechol pathway
VKILRYIDGTPGCQPRLAVGIGDEKPVDLVRAWIEVTGGLEGDVGPSLTSALQLIEGGVELWGHVETVARAASDMTELQVDESDSRFKWLCPMDVVPSLRDFLAFEDHVKLGAERRGTDVPAYWYEAPVYYKGNHRAIIGPDDVCPWPSYTEQLDFELELAMIVGKRGRDIPREKAGDYVFGFTIMNDFSARDIQAREMTAWLGPSKGKDFATALGPCIVTADEIGTEPDLEMICRVNGEEWGRARSSQAHWRWADMIAHVSRDEDIYPGDVYGSGTPGGCCGVDLDRAISHGDAIELEIERIGNLRSLTETSRTP